MACASGFRAAADVGPARTHRRSVPDQRSYEVIKLWWRERLFEGRDGALVSVRAVGENQSGFVVAGVRETTAASDRRIADACMNNSVAPSGVGRATRREQQGKRDRGQSRRALHRDTDCPIGLAGASRSAVRRYQLFCRLYCRSASLRRCVDSRCGPQWRAV